VTIRFAQMICDALAAAVVFIIAAELLSTTIAMIAGVLVALSPHLVYHSMRLSPDSLAVLPILLATYLIIKAVKRTSIAHVIAAGVLIGVSCWLRSNALLLAPFFAILVLLLFERGKGRRYSATLILTAATAIAPITIRNLIVFHHFIPLSLGSGITLIE